ncbi:DUF86 domain-containing protein [Brachybacterium sp. UMB0905]|uniref:type VII toxin-antitoxin system HepT family RNase toxin n=1 Tax=Brachybacterium sp. UMB0905 TaxID=2069310 RepID=UPI001304479A|nr:DUF86 domain-containing protein [Brachybacterium sp. UMB0905]
MTPRDFSSAVVTRRLSLMHELLEDLEALGPVSRERLETDRLALRALERIMTQLVDCATDINQHIASSHRDEIPGDYRASCDLAARTGAISEDLAGSLKPSVGLRNVLTHEYMAVDLDALVSAVPPAADQYGAYVRSVARWVSDR